MTRLYIQPSFLNSCEEHGLWSGGNDQYRGDRSVDLATFDKNGRARVEAFSDSAIESLKKRKTSIPLSDRILPQAKRVRLLTEQLYELEEERKKGMNLDEYSLLRDILISKRDRAEELYKKAINQKPIRSDDEYQDETPQVKGENTLKNGDSKQWMHTYSPYTNPAWMIDFVNDIPEGNVFKNLLERACKGLEKVLQFSHKISSYLNELKAV